MKESANAEGGADAGRPPENNASQAQPEAETNPEAETTPEQEEEDDEEDEDDEENGCAFCRYMRGGGCRKVFIAWEKCVDSAREKSEDFAAQCFEETMALQECMNKPENREYYQPMLEDEAEYAREQEQERDAAAKKAAESSDNAATSKSESKA